MYEVFYMSAARLTLLNFDKDRRSILTDGSNCVISPSSRREENANSLLSQSILLIIPCTLKLINITH